MIHFTFLEQAGLALAVMSNRQDGDCSSNEHSRDTVRTFLRQINLQSDQLIRIRQVHGTRVVAAADTTGVASAQLPDADGVITNGKGVALGISVADCAPVILYNPVHRTVAALHAGREGIRHNIVSIGIQFLCDQFGGSSDQLLALTGPCAGVCCYEVAPNMADDWRRAGLCVSGCNLDMSRTIGLQLENAGVIRHNIHVVPHCTVCGGGFYSYRADKTSHRNLVIVML